MIEGDAGRGSSSRLAGGDVGPNVFRIHRPIAGFQQFTSGGSSMIGRSWTVRARLGLAMAAVLGLSMIGCSGDFIPPPPSTDDSAEVSGAMPARAGKPVDVRSSVTPDAAGTVRRIDVIFATRHDPYLADLERIAARTQAGYEHARLHFFPDEAQTEPVAKKSQAAIVRDSIAAKASAIIIDPDAPADQELAAALRDARAAKIPVVLLGHPFTAETDPKSKGAAPMIVVAPTPFAESAKRLVELSIRNVKNSRLNPAGGAIVIRSSLADRLQDDRATAIREALKEAGIDAIAEVTVPLDTDLGTDQLVKALQQHPLATMAFFLDLYGVSASNNAAPKVRPKIAFIQAGYVVDESRNRTVNAGQYAGIAEYDANRLIRKAVSVAAAAAHGKATKPREVLAVTIVESPAGAGLPTVESPFERAQSKTESEKDKK